MKADQTNEIQNTDQEIHPKVPVGLTNTNTNIITLPNKSTFFIYIRNTPLFISFIFIFSIFFFILNFIFPNFTKALTNTPEFTITSFRIWSIFMSFLVTLEVQNLFYAFIIWIPEARTLERSLGTLRYIFNFTMNNLIIQMMFIIFSFILSNFSHEIVKTSSCGIIPVMLSEITILSLANPNNLVTFIHIPLQFKALYYPFIVFFVFIVINLKIYVDAICGFIYGLLFYYCLRPYFVITDDFIEKYVNCFPFSYLKFLPGKFKIIVGFIEMPKIKFTYSSFKNNQSIVSISLPDSPSKSSTKDNNNINLNNNNSYSGIENKNISVERLDISHENKNEAKIKMGKKYHNLQEEN